MTTELPVFKQDVEAPTRQNRNRKRCLLRCCFGFLAVAVIATVTWAIAWSVLVASFPELEMDEPCGVSNFNGSLGKLGAYAHDIVKFPSATMADGRIINGTDESPVMNKAKSNHLDVSVCDYDADNDRLVEHNLHFDDDALSVLSTEDPTSLDMKAEHQRRSLGPHGVDSRRSVEKNEAQTAPFKSVVRLRTREWAWNSGWNAGFVEGYCSGTLVDDDVILTAAHCVYKQGRYDLPKVEVAPWKASMDPFKPGSWGSGHAGCDFRPWVSYPCGIRWCRGWWGWSFPCGYHVCHRYAPSPPDCSWQYETERVVVPEAWKSTACQADSSKGCSNSDFQNDIALLKIKQRQGKHAGTRAGWLNAVHLDEYGTGDYRITGYPGDRKPFMATATGPIERVDENLVKHKIDANSGQSGSGLVAGNNVVAVHVCGGGGSDCARRIDAWWLQILRSNF